MQIPIKDNDLVFPSPIGRDKSLTRSAFVVWIKRLAARAGLKRNIYPYLARHTKATQLYHEMGDKASRALGHSPDMKKIYLHTTEDEVKAALLKMYDVDKELTPEENDRLKRVEKELKEIKKLIAEQLGIKK